MTRRRVFVLLGVLLALGLVAAWRAGVWHSASAVRVDQEAPQVSALSSLSSPSSPRGGPADDVWHTRPAACDWAAEALVEAARWERVDELPKEIAVFQTVFWEPRDTTSLRAWLAGQPPLEGKTVLEIGTGSGLLALCCLNAKARKVVATDVNPAALCNALFNASNMGFADRLELRRVPLRGEGAGAFSVVGDSETFDFVISNPPWEDGVPATIDKYAYYDPGFHLLHSLLEGLGAHLKPGGKALLAYGSREAIKSVIRLAPRYSLEVKVLDERDLDGLPDVFLPGMMLEVTPVRAATTSGDAPG